MDRIHSQIPCGDQNRYGRWETTVSRSEWHICPPLSTRWSKNQRIDSHLVCRRDRRSSLLQLDLELIAILPSRTLFAVVDSIRIDEEAPGEEAPINGWSRFHGSTILDRTEDVSRRPRTISSRCRRLWTSPVRISVPRPFETYWKRDARSMKAFRGFNLTSFECCPLDWSILVHRTWLWNKRRRQEWIWLISVSSPLSNE